MTAVTPLPTRPFDDSTDSLLRFAMRLEATLSGLVGLFIALMADSLSALTGLSSSPNSAGAPCWCSADWRCTASPQHPICAASESASSSAMSS